MIKTLKRKMRKLILALPLLLSSVCGHTEKFTYLTKSITIIQNGLDKETVPKSTVIVVDTDNQILLIEGEKYQIVVGSAYGAYPELYFNVKNGSQKFKVCIDYDYKFFIIDFRNGHARKYRFIQSSMNP